MNFAKILAFSPLLLAAVSCASNNVPSQSDASGENTSQGDTSQGDTSLTSTTTEATSDETSNLLVWIKDPLDREGMQEMGCTYLPGWFGAEEWLDYRYEAEEITSDERTQLIVPEKHVTYLFSGYPDMADPWVATKIAITDPDIFVYGLTMASTQQDISNKMTSMGFEKIDDGTNIDYSCYGKDDCFFSYSSSGITIATGPATNNSHIIY